jgi:hypothetical protein
MRPAVRTEIRRLLCAALAVGLFLVPVLGAWHQHEPCHRGLHVGPPHATNPPQDVCAVCRVSQQPGAEATPPTAFADARLVAVSLRPSQTRSVATRETLTPSPRAPPVLLSIPV